MPSIIDSLIVELSLDTSKFTEGQKRAAESLRQFEQQVGRAAGNIGTGAGRIRSFFSSFTAPIQAAGQQLNNLSSQSRRTGAAVAAGAQAGAVGLSQMASAGLAAYAALRSVEGLMRSVAASSARGAELGRVAPEAGVRPQWLAAVANAAQKMTGADPEAVKAEIANLENSLQLLATGHGFNEQLQELARIGVDAQGKTKEQVLAETADKFAAMSPQERATRARLTGFGATGRALAQDSGRFNAEITNQMSVSTTQRQTEAYERLQRAINSTFIAYKSLVDKMVEGNPGLSRVIEIFDKWLRDLQATPEGLKKVETALTIVSGAIGIMLTLMVARFVAANAAVLATPLGRLLLLGAALGALPSYGMDENLKNAPGAPSNPPDNGWGIFWDALNPKNWAIFGGKSSKEGKGASSTGDQSPGSASGYSDPATAAAGRIISYRESRDRDVNNFKYDEPGARRMGPNGVEVGYTAGGYHQMLDTNWVKYARQLGIDTQKYPRAKGSPKEMQEAVFSAMFKKEGWAPWSTAAGGPMTPAAIVTAQGQDRLKNIKPWNPTTLIRNQATVASRNGDATTHNYGNSTIGDITVHTQATDGEGTVAAIRAATERGTLVSRANTGLDG